jgi:hypothetical protein
MRYARVNLDSDSHYYPVNILDPEPYLRVLPEISPQLPKGARAFACNSEHYDFMARRSVKDLMIGSISVSEAGNAQLDVQIAFKPSPFKHDEGLVIDYHGVVRFNIDVAELSERAPIWPATRRLGDVQLDEILPIPGGCTHEIVMTGGTIFVECVDLEGYSKFSLKKYSPTAAR